MVGTWLYRGLLVKCRCPNQAPDKNNRRAGTTVILDSTQSSFLVLIKSGRCQIVVQLTPDRPSTVPGTIRNYSATINRPPTAPVLLQKRDGSAHPLGRSLLPRTSYSASHRAVASHRPARPRPQTVGPSSFSLRGRGNLSDLDCSDKRPDDKGRHSQQKVCTVTQTRFVSIGSLEQGGIFGLAETMDKSSKLRFSLVSEGAECILIPSKLFMAEAPVKSRQVAQELVDSFPTELKIRECYTTLQTWSAYKDKLLGRQLNSLKDWNSGREMQQLT
ncbi:uncharacterized protein [Hyperolius riggenbachi]|uniref:uncharacterized protein n=1 Tax=Hyperolius riggenbachi TaxID=752182 RepID=UPI0035A32D7E